MFNTIFKKHLPMSTIFFSLTGLTSVFAITDVNLSQSTLLEKLKDTSIPFIKNQGQTHQDVSFYAKTFTGTVFVSKHGELVYSLPRKTKEGKKHWAFKESFIADKKLSPQAEALSEIKVNIFKGKPVQWQTNLTTTNIINLGSISPGIHVKLQAKASNVEKLFYLAPGAAPKNIKVKLQGINNSKIDASGQLVLNTDLGPIYFTAPIAFQMKENHKQFIQVAYVLKDNQYSFELGDYDKTRELIIDPLLASTYLGGVNANPPQYSNYDQDIAYSIISSADAVYVGGVTQSTDFPTVLGFDDTANASGKPDGFIAKFSHDLTTLIASTYFGTENFDRVSAIALDSDGTIVATGQAGYGFPVTPGAYNYQGSEPVGGGFVAKFSADLSTLIASAVVTPSDYPTEIAIGNAGIYMAGRTNNPNFPITDNAFLKTCCPSSGSYGIRPFDGFAGKLSSDLSTLEAMTYLGGDVVTGIEVAPDSSVYITDGGDGISGYLAQFDADLTTRFEHIAYYPGTTSGSSRHYFNDVKVGSDYVIAAGQTYLNDLPVTAGAYDNGCGSDGNCDNPSANLYLPKPDGFIAKYSLDLKTLLAMTYLGGSDADAIRSIDLDSTGNIYVAGETISSDFPTSRQSHDSNCGTDSACNPSGSYNRKASDIFVAKLTNDLSQLSYGSYLGGSKIDYAYDITLSADDKLFVAGRTDSANFPTTSGAVDRSYAGGAGGANALYDSDAIVSQFDTSGNGSNSNPAPTPDPIPDSVSNITPTADAGNDQSVGSRKKTYLNGRDSYDSDGFIQSYRWKQVSGKSVSLRKTRSSVAKFRAPRIRNGKTYTLVFELTVTDNDGARSRNKVAVFVQ